ncbi:Flp family type IVb pilin [Halalkalibacillus sediminis]|uniref:Flp family type IVb pilin n=1 Tax=Halalkalibacillus sediminis TaxID=2018042 RepID=A0A2I0QSF9_9BACI|nr:Flp family type IVb pilin [Halalkalibacillus sediminis]PKR77271.1 Flp family type IVb pilin [Halalkalibacillus sediminis]
MKQFFENFLREEDGQGMAEYALILGVLAVGVVAVLITFGDAIIDAFNDVIAKFDETPTGTDSTTG